MATQIHLVFLTAFFVLVPFADSKTDRIICYYGSWANYRNGNGRFTVEDIDPHLCTHIIYTFLGIEVNGNLKILDTWLEIDLRNLQRFNALKSRNPNLKTLIAVGGWNEGSLKYSKVAADPTKRENLIRSAVKILETYGFDGFDIDWEYPGQRGGASSDKSNFVALLKEFRKEFDKRGFILTAAVAAAPNSVDISYDVPGLSRYLDSINVMAYDFHGAYDGKTGANAPLYHSNVDSTENAKTLSVNASISGWLARGADPRKISMGLPIYGRTFTLSSANVNGLGSPVRNSGVPGPYTRERGMLGFLEICEMQQQGGWTKIWDHNTKTPFTYKGDQWVGYDDAESIQLKVEYAKSLNLGGVMIWSLETTDFKGICGTKYPILKTINEVLKEGSESKETDEDDGSSTEETSEEDETIDNTTVDDNTSEESYDEPICKEGGLVRDPTNCSAFYFCVPQNLNFIKMKLFCSSGLVFDNTVNACNYPNLVDCKK